MIVDAHYNRIKENAFHDELFLIGSDSVELNYNPEATESPYTEEDAFIAKPLVDGQTVDEQMYFHFPGELFVNNRNYSWPSLFEVDLDDGAGFQIVNEDDVIAANWIDARLYHLTFRVTHGGETRQTTVMYKFNGIRETSVSYPDEGFFNISAQYESETYDGAYGFFPGCGDEISRPFIIVERFNTRYKIAYRNIEERIQDIEDRINRTGKDGTNLIEDLRELGFDIFILAFEDNHADIRANAKVLEALIDHVNDIKSTDEELLIMGESMGGIIARYALADMEARDKDHHTRMYISYDSPHLGAYIPEAGRQLYSRLHFLKVFDYFLVELDEAITMLDEDHKPMLRVMDEANNSTVAKQLMNFFTEVTLLAPAMDQASIRKDFAQELNTLGFPEQTYNISILDGATDQTGQTGNNVSFSSGDPVMEIELLGNISWGFYFKGWALPDGSGTVAVINYDVCRWPYICNKDKYYEEVIVYQGVPFDNSPG